MEVSKGSIVNAGALKQKTGVTTVILPGRFEPAAHFYPRVLNAVMHSTVAQFFQLGPRRIAQRYAATHAGVSEASVADALAYQPQHFLWAGCDTFHVMTGDGHRVAVVIETNSCPSGQKSMPLLDGCDEQGGYRRLVTSTFARVLRASGAQVTAPAVPAADEAAAADDAALRLDAAGVDGTLRGSTGGSEGVLAVIHDKNHMEASGYASAIADAMGEAVYLSEMFLTDPDPPVRWDDEHRMHVRDSDGKWLRVRACMRYVTQRPWTRIPLKSRTPMLNGVLPCIAGGRNKLVAAHAYEEFNAALSSAGSSLRIRTPATVRDVSKVDVPAHVRAMGGTAVVKVPYGNAGQGVYTITSSGELDAFMSEAHHYDRFIVQQLVGHPAWSTHVPTHASSDMYHHVGTVPDVKGRVYVADVRVMVGASDAGLIPMAMYARRARDPLTDALAPTDELGRARGGASSWGMLGTNLSVMTADLTWGTESERLVMMDSKDFATLGLGLDELIDAYVQTVLAVTAIDRMCARLLTPSGDFDVEAFTRMNDDPTLLSEIKR